MSKERERRGRERENERKRKRERKRYKNKVHLQLQSCALSWFLYHVACKFMSVFYSSSSARRAGEKSALVNLRSLTIHRAKPDTTNLQQTDFLVVYKTSFHPMSIANSVQSVGRC